MLKEVILTEPSAVEDWVGTIKKNWQEIPPLDLSGTKFQHLAIICDGNRRSAQERGLPPFWGHRAGVETIKGIMKAGRQWGINNLTFWLWSTENWKRDVQQVDFVMGLAARFLQDPSLVQELTANQTRFIHLGRKDRLPQSVAQSIEALEKLTAHFSNRTVNACIDYGGLDEMVRAVIRMKEQISIGRFNLNDLETDPDIIKKFLDTGSQPDPHLVLRTGCQAEEMPRSSGFMPLQTAYSGWLFDPVLFPDLTPDILQQSICKFINCQMRKGR